MLANCINGQTAAHIIASKVSYGKELKYKDKYTGIISNYRFDEAMYNNINFNIKEYQSSILSYLLKLLYTQISYVDDNLFFLFDQEFKFCPICIANGFHAVYHQFSFMDTCLIHNIKLHNTCPHCKKAMEYGIVFSVDNSAFCCPNCKIALVKYGFERMIEEWLRNKQLTFIPFLNYENLYPVIFKTKSVNRINSRILNIIKEMFLGKEITYKPILTISNKVGNQVKNLSYKYRIHEIAYFEAFKFVNHHIRKSKNVNYHKLKKITKCRDLDHAYAILGLDYILKLVTGSFDFNSYVYYLWKRDLEFYNNNNCDYEIDRISDLKTDISPNYVLINILEKYVDVFNYAIKDEKIVLDLLIYIASILMLEKFRIWEKHVKNMMVKKNELGMMIALKDEALDYNETLLKELLIIIDENNNCRLY